MSGCCLGLSTFATVAAVSETPKMTGPLCLGFPFLRSLSSFSLNIPLDPFISLLTAFIHDPSINGPDCVNGRCELLVFQRLCIRVGVLRYLTIRRPFPPYLDSQPYNVRQTSTHALLYHDQADRIVDFLHALNNIVIDSYVLLHRINLDPGPACVFNGFAGQVTSQVIQYMEIR